MCSTHKYLSFVIVILLLCIFWFWNMTLNHPDLPKIKLEDATFKTGDMLLFHAYDNINPVFMGSYWGHVGIVYVDPAKPSNPVVFEATNIVGMKQCPEYNKNGITITDLKTRIEKYPGIIACKYLANPLDANIIIRFKDFINYAKDNMYYNVNVVTNGFAKLFGDMLHTGTNCGEITFLSLIKLNLISKKTLLDRICHHLLYVVNLENLKNNKYLPPVEITYSQF